MKKNNASERNEKPTKNRKGPPEDIEKMRASGGSHTKRKEYIPQESFDDAPVRKRNSDSAKRQTTDKAKRKKSSTDSKSKKSKVKAKKVFDDTNSIDSKDYGDDFYTDELELKRKRARQKIDERQLPEIDIEKKPLSHKKRKLKNIGVAASIISIILIIGVVLSLTVFFRSEQFTVEGAEHYSAQDIIDASGMRLGENLFLSDKGAGEERIESSLPYVEEAKISIKIPNTMVITITESQPAFIFQNGSEYIIVSSQGKVMEKVKGTAEKYDAPVVLGCTVKSADLGKEITFKESGILSILKGVAEGLSVNEFSGIKEIDITNTARICLNYSNRIKIVLGLPEDISYKLKTAKIIISEKLSETDAGELDVSGCKSESKASYFDPDPSIYIDKRTQTTQSAAEAPTDAATQAQTQTETATDAAQNDYSLGVPAYEYPTDEYGNIIYDNDDGNSDENDYDNGYDNSGDYNYDNSDFEDSDNPYSVDDYQ